MNACPVYPYPVILTQIGLFFLIVGVVFMNIALFPCHSKIRISIPFIILIGALLISRGIWMDIEIGKSYEELPIENRLSAIRNEIYRRATGETEENSYLVQRLSVFSNADLHTEEWALRGIIETTEKAKHMESAGYELPSDLSKKLALIESRLANKKDGVFEEVISEMSEAELTEYAAEIRKRLERAEEFAERIEKGKK